ncbi:type II toxin-antitoxin system RelE/ParE family toxin, partial [Planktothrix rubescens]
MKIKWLRRALRNLEILYTYISSDDADAARQTIVRIQDAVNQLAQYPFMGRYGRVEG